MKKLAVLSAILGVILVASNLLWAYSSLESAVIAKHRYQEMRELRGALRQLLPLATELAKGRPQDALVDQVARFSTFSPTYEQDNVVVVGWVRLKFTPDGLCESVDANLMRTALEPAPLDN